MVNYSIIENINDKYWSKMVKSHSQGNIFQSTEMYQVYKETKNYEPVSLAVVNEKDEILAVLLAVIQKEHQGLLGIFSSRSIIIGGPLVKDKNTKVLDFLLSEYNKRINGKAIYSQIRNIFDQSWAKEIYFKHSFEYEAHLDILHDLKIPLEEQFTALHKGRRKNIRRAERSLLVFRQVVDKHEFNISLELIKGTYNRVKLPIPDDSLFRSSFKELYSLGIMKIFVAEYNEQIIGARMVLCYGDLIYDWYAGASEDHLDKYPNDYLPWKIMEWGSENGYLKFDFGGAGKPNVPYGVRDHKLKFGGDLVEFGRYEAVHNHLLLKIGELGLKVYKKIK